LRTRRCGRFGDEQQVFPLPPVVAARQDHFVPLNGAGTPPAADGDNPREPE